MWMLPPIGPKEADDLVDERRLAGAVVAEQAVDLTAIGAQGDAVIGTHALHRVGSACRYVLVISWTSSSMVSLPSDGISDTDQYANTNRMSIPIGLPVLGGILLPMSDPLSPAQRAIREAAEEVRRETAAAATEIRLELRSARRETRSALRDAMAEVREAMRDVLRETIPDDPGMPVSTRLTRAERKELTRELLLDAAIEVFAQRGYHGASLEDVAAAAGFTKGAVYSNFETQGGPLHGAPGQGDGTAQRGPRARRRQRAHGGAAGPRRALAGAAGR